VAGRRLATNSNTVSVSHPAKRRPTKACSARAARRLSQTQSPVRAADAGVMSLRLSIVIVLLSFSSSSSQLGSRASRESTAVASPAANVEPTPSLTPIQPIRLIDFSAVAFPHYPEYTDRAKKYVTLKPGDGRPAMLNYGDVTGDGLEEALMMLGIASRGSAIPEIVYIFGLEERKPKVLWSFETGDRADGGLRQLYGDGGNLVVELYGRGKVIGTNLYADDGTRSQQPYPYIVTRTRYRWLKNHFELIGKPEEFSEPSGYGSAIMPYYDGPGK
jgi:hypothetical protein